MEIPKLRKSSLTGPFPRKSIGNRFTTCSTAAYRSRISATRYRLCQRRNLTLRIFFILFVTVAGLPKFPLALVGLAGLGVSLAIVGNVLSLSSIIVRKYRINQMKPLKFLQLSLLAALGVATSADDTAVSGVRGLAREAVAIINETSTGACIKPNSAVRSQAKRAKFYLPVETRCNNYSCVALE